MKRIISICLVTGIFLGCVTMATQEDKVKFFDISYDEAFDKIKRILFETNCEIMDANKEAGFIIGRFKHSSELYTAIILGEVRILYTHYKFMFFERSNGVEIVANIYTAYEDGSHALQATQEGYLNFWKKF